MVLDNLAPPGNTFTPDGRQPYPAPALSVTAGFPGYKCSLFPWANTYTLGE